MTRYVDQEAMLGVRDQGVLCWHAGQAKTEHVAIHKNEHHVLLPPKIANVYALS
jgi:hypothetical protein